MTATINWDLPPVSVCMVPAHLLNGEADHLPIRAVGVARMLSWPLHRRGELVAWLEGLPAIEPTTTLRGGVWSCRTIRKALKDAPQFMEYVGAGSG